MGTPAKDASRAMRWSDRSPEKPVRQAPSKSAARAAPSIVPELASKMAKWVAFQVPWSRMNSAMGRWIVLVKSERPIDVHVDGGERVHHDDGVEVAVREVYRPDAERRRLGVEVAPSWRRTGS